jgi:hypothetical protein
LSNPLAEASTELADLSREQYCLLVDRLDKLPDAK